jgi:hypothetical protein
VRLWGIDALKADAVLRVGAVQYRDRVAIGHANDAPADSLLQVNGPRDVWAAFGLFRRQTAGRRQQQQKENQRNGAEG